MSKFNAKKMIVVDLGNGSYLKEHLGYERFNLEKNPVDCKFYGYCPPKETDGVTISNFDRTAKDYVDGILVVYVEKDNHSNDREIIAFCPSARVYRKPQFEERLKRTFKDKNGEEKKVPYSFKSDELYRIENRFKIKTNVYNSYMFRMQRFYGGKYPELDKKIIAYIENILMP
ncbi:hypothetical protein R83H12_01929 [Fibrobacteria bacterium R8-3-H12]